MKGKKPIYTRLRRKNKKSYPIDHTMSVVGTDDKVKADVTKDYRVIGLEVLDYEYITIDGIKI